MTDYRRNYIEGGTYFFTVNLAERKQKLLKQNKGGGVNISRRRPVGWRKRKYN